MSSRVIGLAAFFMVAIGSTVRGGPPTKLRIAMDGRSVGGEWDLYGGCVSPSGSLELGNHDLTPGQHRMRFRVIGKNASSSGHLFGVDAIDLLDE
jgi:hypothetical protein